MQKYKDGCVARQEDKQGVEKQPDRNNGDRGMKRLDNVLASIWGADGCMAGGRGAHAACS